MGKFKELTIPGLTFRYFQGKADYPVIKDVFNRCKSLDGFEYTMTLESVTHHFEHIERCNPFTDMIIVEIMGEPIAYSRVGWYPESSGNYIYYALGFVAPEWRRKGIGTAILQHNERRIREMAQEHPADTPKFFQNDASDKRPDVNFLLKKNKYEEVRWNYKMKRPIDAPLPDAPIPKGLEIRQATCDEHYRAIYRGSNEAFRDHWGHSEATEEEYQRWLSNPVTFDPGLWKVAWDGNEIAGMVLNFLDKDENKEYKRLRGYTEDISVRRPWRRCGLARALLVQSILMFREMGMEETTLRVDTLNPNNALNLYEGVGYKVVSVETTYRKSFNI